MLGPPTRTPTHSIFQLDELRCHSHSHSHSHCHCHCHAMHLPNVCQTSAKVNIQSVQSQSMYESVQLEKPKFELETVIFETLICPTQPTQPNPTQPNPTQPNPTLSQAKTLRPMEVGRSLGMDARRTRRYRKEHLDDSSMYMADVARYSIAMKKDRYFSAD